VFRIVVIPYRRFDKSPETSVRKSADLRKNVVCEKIKNHAEKMSDLGDHEDGGRKLLRSVAVKS
jgi:hypothetical protein